MSDSSVIPRPPRTLRERLDLYERLMRLDRPVGILLLLWPALWALWLATRGRPEWLLVWVFVIGAVLMRSAGCIVNDVADRDFDRHVRRTRDRPITAGRIGVREALVLAALLTLLAGALVIVLLDTQTVLLSLLALAVAFSYPFSKRFFALPQAWLGIAFGFGVPMAWSAATGSVPVELPAMPFGGTVISSTEALAPASLPERSAASTLALMRVSGVLRSCATLLETSFMPAIRLSIWSSISLSARASRSSSSFEPCTGMRPAMLPAMMVRLASVMASTRRRKLRLISTPPPSPSTSAMASA